MKTREQMIEAAKDYRTDYNVLDYRSTPFARALDLAFTEALADFALEQSEGWQSRSRRWSFIKKKRKP